MCRCIFTSCKEKNLDQLKTFARQKMDRGSTIEATTIIKSKSLLI